MNKHGKIIIVVTLFIAIAGVLAIKQTGNPDIPAAEVVTQTTTSAPTTQPATMQPQAALPRLVDLGAGKCIPCKMMAPILDQLKVDFKEQLEVIFIDVWENPDAGQAYGIRMIPTQVFFDARGKELFRHEGFFSREDILAKWRELGVPLKFEQKAMGDS